MDINNMFKDKPYELYHGDCLAVMKDIPDKSINLILCDLPYGQTAQDWDKIIPSQPLWEHYNRILKDNGTICLFSAQPFTTELINSNINDFRYCWYWIKNQGTNFFHAKEMPIRKVEEICVFHKGIYNPQITDGHTPTNSAKGCSNGKLYYGTNKRNYEGGKTTRYPTNILEYKCVDNYHRLHPNEKPVSLLRYLVNTYTNDNDNHIILDNCIGSGGTGVATIEIGFGRKFIGIEKDDKYFNIAKNRISDTYNKLMEKNN